MRTEFFFFHIHSDPHVMEFPPEVLSREENDALIDPMDARVERHGVGWCAVETKEDGRFIGFIGLAVSCFEVNFTPSVEMGRRRLRWLGVEAW
jgi:RimJ/RimL family protein N-acetyltransferase